MHFSPFVHTVAAFRRLADNESGEASRRGIVRKMVSWWCYVCCIAIHFASFALGALVCVPKHQLALSVLRPDKNTRAHLQYMSTTTYWKAVKVARKFDAAPVQQAVTMQEYQKDWHQRLLKSTRFSYEEFNAKKMSNAGHLWTPKLAKDGSYYIAMMHSDVFGNDIEFRMFVQAMVLSMFLQLIRNKPGIHAEQLDLVHTTIANYVQPLQDSYALYPPPIASLKAHAELICKREKSTEPTKTAVLSLTDLHRLCSAMLDPNYSHRLLAILILKSIAGSMKSSDATLSLLKTFFPKSKLLAIKAPFETTYVHTSLVRIGEVLDNRSFLLMLDFACRRGTVSFAAKAYAQPGDMLIGLLPCGNYPASTPIAILLRGYMENSLVESSVIAGNLGLENLVLSVQVPAQVMKGDECYMAFVTDALLKNPEGPFPNFIGRINAQKLPDPYS